MSKTSMVRLTCRVLSLAMSIQFKFSGMIKISQIVGYDIKSKYP